MHISGTGSYVATGEVTTLEHELGDDTVEGRVLVTEALLARAKSAEVLGGLGDILVEEVEIDATLLSCNRKVRSAGTNEQTCFGGTGRQVAWNRGRQRVSGGALKIVVGRPRQIESDNRKLLTLNR